jgi:hypothetical protein
MPMKLAAFYFSSLIIDTALSSCPHKPCILEAAQQNAMAANFTPSFHLSSSY